MYRHVLRQDPLPDNDRSGQFAAHRLNGRQGRNQKSHGCHLIDI